jgi:hypothetical protein
MLAVRAAVNGSFVPLKYFSARVKLRRVKRNELRPFVLWNDIFSHIGARMSTDDDDEIAKYLARQGATKCPPKAARELGEVSSGWRRERERRAERAQSERAQKRQQKALRERAGFTGDGE